MPIERAVTLHRYVNSLCVTTYSPTDGIVLWEMQEQKCQLHMCQHTDVVQPSQAGWKVIILQWKMVKFTRRSALVIVLLVVEPRGKFL